MARFYVYALIDPDANAPKYIGKGMSARTEQHFREAEKTYRLIGVDSKDVANEDEANTDQSNKQKVRWLHDMATKGYKHHHIARLIGRELTEEQARTVESFLLTHVYAKEDLLNIQAGEYAKRFRPKGNWELWGADLEAVYPYYVYVLRDPSSGCTKKDGIFYVGKGSGRRLNQHFEDAENLVDEPDDPERLRDIRRLRNTGWSREKIGYVVARVETEREAFLLEALLIKFVYGMHQLANQVTGHYSESVRPKDSWKDPLPGFDKAKIVNPDIRQDRSDLLTLLLAEGLGSPLDQVRVGLSSLGLLFGSYKVLDSGELGMEAPLAGTWVKVFTRRKKLQVEMRPRKQAQRQWMRDHFRALGALDLLRRDAVFIPACWRGARNMTSDPSEMIERIKLMMDLAKSTRSNRLPESLKTLLSQGGVERTLERHFSTEDDDSDGVEEVDKTEEIVMPMSKLPRGGNALLQRVDQLPVVQYTGPAPCEHCFTSLQQIADLFPDIPFDDPRSRDAGEICIEAVIGSEGDAVGAKLKVSCRKSGYGIELRGRTVAQKVWLKEQLISLGCNLPRVVGAGADVVFLPTSWKHSANIARSAQIAADRISHLLQIVTVSCPDDLDDEARALLTE